MNPIKKTEASKNLAFIFMFSFLLTSMVVSDVRAGNIPMTKADHLAVADKYEKLAADQEAVAKEHAKMKKDYQSNQVSLPKASREQSIRDMDKHCDALIQAAQKEAEEYRAISQWHKIRATEVE